MHILHQLLPNPLGDSQEVLKRQIFGPRQKPGVEASGSSTVTADDTSLLVAARAFALHTAPAHALLAHYDCLDDTPAFPGRPWLGMILYADASGRWTRTAPQSNAGKRFFTQTGTGSGLPSTA